MSDINAIADEALNLAYHGARAENSNFNIEMDTALSENIGKIECYPQDIMRVFLNLITNAMYAAHSRHSNSDGKKKKPGLKINIQTRKSGENVEIEIRDNGNGISTENQEKIFTPFFTTKPAGEGTGLGLSLSYDIVVTQHGGAIMVDSDPAVFTAFTVTLPCTLTKTSPQKEIAK